MQKRIMIIFFINFFLICSASYPQTKDESAIRKILSNQVNAWNKGSLENFMQGYWQNDSLKFIGKSGITYGWKQTLENYKKSYPNTTAMGKLGFDIVEIKNLSSQYYFVIGKWKLTRSKDDLSGYFTLLFRKINNHWLIIADHSS